MKVEVQGWQHECAQVVSTSKQSNPLLPPPIVVLAETVDLWHTTIGKPIPDVIGIRVAAVTVARLSRSRPLLRRCLTVRVAAVICLEGQLSELSLLITLAQTVYFLT